MYKDGCLMPLSFQNIELSPKLHTHSSMNKVVGGPYNSAWW